MGSIKDLADLLIIKHRSILPSVCQCGYCLETFNRDRGKWRKVFFQAKVDKNLPSTMSKKIHNEPGQAFPTRKALHRDSARASDRHFGCCKGLCSEKCKDDLDTFKGAVLVAFWCIIEMYNGILRFLFVKIYCVLPWKTNENMLYFVKLKC